MTFIVSSDWIWNDCGFFVVPARQLRSIARAPDGFETPGTLYVVSQAAFVGDLDSWPDGTIAGEAGAIDPDFLTDMDQSGLSIGFRIKSDKPRFLPLDSE